MSTTTAPPRVPAPARVRGRTRLPEQRESPKRSLPARALLVELGTADALRDSLRTATTPLRHPAEVRRSIAEAGTGMIERLRRLEGRGERASAKLQREVTHTRERVNHEVRRLRENPPPLVNPVPFPLDLVRH
jgi:hypothetical protein